MAQESQNSKNGFQKPKPKTPVGNCLAHVESTFPELSTLPVDKFFVHYGHFFACG